ncbi:hypothetical protein [Pseudomonas fluorescens]
MNDDSACANVLRSREFELAWSPETLNNEWVVHSSNIYSAVAMIIRATSLILETKGEVLAKIQYVASNAGFHIVSSKRAEIVVEAMRVSAYESGYEEMKSVLKLSPYVHAFFELRSKFKYNFKAYSKESADNNVKDVNAYVRGLCAHLNSGEFKKTERNHRRASDKNFRSTSKYIDDILNCWSRLLVVRVDLGYSGEESDLISREGYEVHSYHPEICEHRKSLFKALSKKDSPISMVGYACKLEYGIRKGFHFHVMLLLDGSKHREHLTMGIRVGELWQQVTCGKGHYWNCVPRSWHNVDGTGRLDYYDLEKIQKVKEAASYLTKIDRWVRAYLPGDKRSFYKGVVKKLPGQKGGRPRTK